VSAKRYRDNVCAVIRGKSGNSVCLFHRKNFPPDAGWQFPQGGIDTQKDIIDELKRELREEIGTDNISVIALSPHIYYYDFPAGVENKHSGYCGQMQRWVLVELQNDEIEIIFYGDDAEFDAYQWVAPQEAVDRIVPFKKDVYIKALHDFKLL